MWTCFCCGKELPDTAIENVVVTEEGDEVTIGSDCARKTRESGTEGHFSEVSGVSLYTRSNYAALDL